MSKELNKRATFGSENKFAIKGLLSIARLLSKSATVIEKARKFPKNPKMANKTKTASNYIHFINFSVIVFV